VSVYHLFNYRGEKKLGVSITDLSKSIFAVTGKKVLCEDLEGRKVKESMDITNRMKLLTYIPQVYFENKSFF